MKLTKSEFPHIGKIGVLSIFAQQLAERIYDQLFGKELDSLCMMLDVCILKTTE